MKIFCTKQTLLKFFEFNQIFIGGICSKDFSLAEEIV